jgi:hypothetical protein
MNLDLSSLQITRGLDLMRQTLPLILIRLGAMLAFWVVGLVYLGITFFIASAVGQAVPLLGLILFIVALVGTVPLYNLAYKYVFFMIKAAHIAVIAEILKNGRLPSGEGQLAWGKQRVEERFGEVNVMFVVDELVEGVIRAFTRTVYNFTAWLPGDTLDTLVKIVNRVIQFSMTYIDESVLARSFWEEEQGVWENARDGVALYAMVWKPLLMNAIALMILSYLPGVVGVIILAVPIVLILGSTPLAGWTIIFLIFLAYLIKVAVGDAFAMAVMISAYQRETQGLEPNEDIPTKLDAVSDKFTELRKRAADEMGKMGRRPASPEPPVVDQGPPSTPSDSETPA